DLLNSITNVIAGANGAATRVRRPAAKVDAARGKLHLLLAEDNIVNQRLAVNLLTKAGHEVVIARTGYEVLAAIEKQPLDALLMDVQMPELDGIEATAAIRAREQA